MSNLELRQIFIKIRLVAMPSSTYYDVCLIVSDLTSIPFKRVHRVCLDIE